ncbi:hypothetical protein FHX37_4211 [Haloactinospora alba]|uniref:Replicative helicase inhibitor G39P N-terminal domain-containing protein n=1 Tax=Haloactinospora alba TaxID=405555 RepID=A0A543N6P8_9ACTN|nr:hypothetical protein [Haloactinospora alba]TQN27491.1 hypothetical protein FHX37_4211 [Haloactinospora alba]
MDRTETTALVRYVKAAFPHQHVDEYTPDAWHAALHHLVAADAREAIDQIAREQRFCSPADICAKVRAIRADRIQRAPIARPDPDARDYRQQLHEHLSAVADQRAIRSDRGEPTPPTESYRQARSALGLTQPQNPRGSRNTRVSEEGYSSDSSNSAQPN